ncbi:chondrolectin isoform X2 [Stegostoma tigrinum]|uniref:chondrolectin isoform X2 n=1 Tax=Stegostoma tigrinum TaxID=3053191 RepID=UPI00286FED35|nr:chondrolectin isoform X2 [Stegostoma tigrinum]
MNVKHFRMVKHCQTVCYGGPEYPCYKIAYFQDLSRRIGFEEASQACEMDGGGLVSIRSATEQRLIENLLQDLTKSGSGLSDGDFWIGLRRSNEGQSPNTFGGCPDLYRWTDGSAAKFRNWYADEPSCGSEACVVMYHQLTAQPGLGGPYLYQWNDDRCNMKHNFVCKYASENLMTNESEEHVTSDYVSENVSTGPGVKVQAPSNSADDQHHMVVTESSAKTDRRAAQTSRLSGYPQLQRRRTLLMFSKLQPGPNPMDKESGNNINNTHTKPTIRQADYRLLRECKRRQDRSERGQGPLSQIINRNEKTNLPSSCQFFFSLLCSGWILEKVRGDAVFEGSVNGNDGCC